MPSNQIDILIKYGLDAAKAKEAVAEMEKVGAASKKVGEEARKVTQEATKGMDKWKDAAKGLAFEFPILGRAIQLALNPISLAFTVLAAGIAKISEYTRKWAEITEQAMGAVATPIANVAQQFRTMEEERRRANEAFQATMQGISQDADNAVQRVNSIRTAIEQVIDAQEQFALAQESDPGRQAAIRHDFAARRRLNAQDAEEAIRQRREREFEELESEAVRQRSIFAGLAGGRSRDAIEAELRDGTGPLEESRRRIHGGAEAQRLNLLESRGLPEPLRRAIESRDPAVMRNQLRTLTALWPGGNAQIEAYASSLETLAGVDSQIAATRARRPGLQMASAAYTAMEQAIARSESVRSGITRSAEVSAAIAPLQAQADLARAGTAATQRGAGVAAGLVSRGAAGADAIRAGGRATPEQSAAIQQLTRLLGLQDQTQATVINLLSRMNDSMQSYEQSLRTVQQRLTVTSQRQ